MLNKEYDYFSIAPQHIGKGSALNFLKDYLKINTNDTMAIGDNLNDIDLLKSSGVGIAVANGFAEAVYQFVEF